MFLIGFQICERNHKRETLRETLREKLSWQKFNMCKVLNRGLLHKQLNILFRLMINVPVKFISLIRLQ